MVNNSTNVNKWTTIYHLNSLNTRNTTAYDIGNPGPGLGQVHKYGGISPVNWISPLPSWQLYLQRQYIPYF